MFKNSFGFWKILPFSIRERLEAPNRYDTRREIKNILDNFGTKNFSILDVGAGDCFARKFFNGHKYVAMDIEKNRECKIHLDFIGSIENNPFENNNFDLILCLEVLEHIENYQGAIKEIYRILKDGGRLLLTVPLMAVGYHNDFYRFTPPVLRKILTNVGFKIKKVNPTGGYFRMLGWQISKISYLIKKPKNRVFIIPYYLIKIPVGLVSQIFIPLILFKLDFLDNKKTETCGYLVVAEK